MKIVFRLINFVLVRLLVSLVMVYRYCVSPYLKANCRFTPTCSQYALESLLRFGAFKGGFLTAKRVLRCNPFGSYGVDPVPAVTKKIIKKRD